MKRFVLSHPRAWLSESRTLRTLAEPSKLLHIRGFKCYAYPNQVSVQSSDSRAADKILLVTSFPNGGEEHGNLEIFQYEKAGGQWIW